jgi:CheY-like chemotaxis protein
MEDKIILLIEDDPDDIELIVRTLQQSHIRNKVIVLRDGVEAIDYFFGGTNATPIMPQIILLDLNLPGVSGLDLLRRLRSEEKTKHLPIIVLSASDDSPDIKASYELGANSYIRKPVDFAQFTLAVQKLGLYWLLLNHQPRSPRS